ncbi:MAG: ribonuclease D [Rickettsiales bacterium]|nr:ribonuclease D [Rickettsiales bacterium]
MANYLYENDLPNDLKLEGDLAIDSEAMGLNTYRDRLCVVQISTGDGDAHLVRFDRGQYDAPNLKALLSNPDSQKIFHFARFDLGIIQRYLGIRLENIYCTKIASRLTRTYTERHGFKDICKHLLEIDISKFQQSSDWGASELTEGQIDYAASDVLYLHALREKLNVLLKREDRYELAHELFACLPVRAALDVAGWEEVDIFAHS